jgi:hypothetical protein
VTLCSCSPSEDNKKPQGVLTNTQEKTLNEAKKMDDMSKAIDDKRLKELDEAEGRKTDEKE